MIFMPPNISEKFLDYMNFQNKCIMYVSRFKFTFWKVK